MLRERNRDPQESPDRPIAAPEWQAGSVERKQGNCGGLSTPGVLFEGEASQQAVLADVCIATSDQTASASLLALALNFNPMAYTIFKVV